jgi:hypothetical protein
MVPFRHVWLAVVLAGCHEPAARAPVSVEAPASTPVPSGQDVLRARIDACQASASAERECFAVVMRIAPPSYQRLESMTLAFDGVSFHELRFETALDDEWGSTLIVGPAPAGQHRLSVVAKFVGAPFGIYSYCTYFPFRLRSEVRIELGKGDPPIVWVTFDETGGVTTPVEERLRLTTNVTSRSRLPVTQ